MPHETGTAALNTWTIGEVCTEQNCAFHYHDWGIYSEAVTCLGFRVNAIVEHTAIGFTRSIGTTT